MDASAATAEGSGATEMKVSEETVEWLRGLAAAFIGGGASAITSGITVSAMDSKDYNLAEGAGKLYALMGVLFTVNGLVSAAMFLRQKPVPEAHKVVVKTVQTVEKEPGAVVTTTVKETHVEPQEPKL